MDTPRLQSSPSEVGKSFPLVKLRNGEEAEVASISGNPWVCQRIHEMGLREGAIIRMIRSQSPQVIALHGRRLCLRLSADFEIVVRSISKDPSSDVA